MGLRDLQEHDQPCRRTKTDAMRSMLWLVSCGYVTVASAAWGVAGTVIAVALLVAVFILGKGIHL